MTRINDIARMAVGLPLSSGSSWSDVHFDSLVDRVREPVIIACSYCQAHNAMTNPCCVQCGAPMGASVRRG